MDCQEAQGSILESLVEGLAADRRAAMENHIAECSACASFAGMQHSLDARMAAALAGLRGVGLSTEFRTSLRRKIRRDPQPAWPDFLPDLAHLGGCVFATGLSVVVLPQYAGAVIVAGAAFTGVTYFFQGLLRSSLEALEGDTW